MKRKLQVFISSTFTDLIAERQAAVSAVLKSGHIPAGMELFTAADRSQLTTIRHWIDESDVYMLILGGRYGSVEKESGISYTELEYDYALQQGKPVFAVVITETALDKKVRAGGSSVTENENPKELKLFREKVLSNISSFFDDEKDIKLCVHESVSDFLATRNLKGWVAADEVVDTKPLFDEISKLGKENNELKELVRALEARPALVKSTSHSKSTSENFDQLRVLLKAIDIKIPAKIAGGQDQTTSLLDLFYHSKDRLINGVTDATFSPPYENFLYHNVCPKLQVHGLSDNEKVTGVRYRRSFINVAGHEFLAELERRLHAENPVVTLSITDDASAAS